MAGSQETTSLVELSETLANAALEGRASGAVLILVGRDGLTVQTGGHVDGFQTIGILHSANVLVMQTVMGTKS